MVCTSLVVSSPAPIVTIVPGTVGFAVDNSYLTDCNPLITSLTGKTIQILVQIEIQNATAKFRLTANWTKDGVAKSSNALQVGSVGTAYYLLLTGISYELGSYTGLTATVSEVTPY